jgi:hypothetical protein
MYQTKLGLAGVLAVDAASSLYMLIMSVVINAACALM